VAKTVLLIIALVGALALISAPAAPAAGTVPVKATISGKGCGIYFATNPCDTSGGGSCLCLDTYYSFSGTGLLAPPIGRVPFQLTYQYGHFCADFGNPDVDLTCNSTIYFRYLTLSFRAANGDTLVLSENFSSTTPFVENPGSGTWTVDRQQSTGRFARYSGSGTYTLTIDTHYDYATVVMSLAGGLTTS
jgi:hypothetical protein